MSTGLMLLLFPQRLQLNILIQAHSIADDNSDSAKTRFCKSITAMPIKHTSKKILFAINLSLQQITMSCRTLGKLQFLLEMLLNRQINTKLKLQQTPPTLWDLRNQVWGNYHYSTINLNHHLKFYMKSWNYARSNFTPLCLSFSCLKFKPIRFSSRFHIKSLDQCLAFGKQKHSLLN